MLPLDKLAVRFETLGDNCEFGLVQRRAGAEPLGLLRFAGFHIPVEQRLERLIMALDARFEGLGRPETVRAEAAGEAGRREYLIRETVYDLMYHSFQPEGRVDPEALRLQEAKKLQFLRRKLLTDLASAEKILVWKSNVRLAESDVMAAVSALGRFGPNTLLWVEEAEPGFPPGTVQRRGEHLLKAHIERLAPYVEATDIYYEGWFRICAEADRLTRESSTTPDAARRAG